MGTSYCPGDLPVFASSYLTHRWYSALTNDTVSLPDTLESVMREDSVDIGTAFISTPHLLPLRVGRDLTEDTQSPPEGSWLDSLDEEDVEEN